MGYYQNGIITYNGEGIEGGCLQVEIVFIEKTQNGSSVRVTFLWVSLEHKPDMGLIEASEWKGKLLKRSG